MSIRIQPFEPRYTQAVADLIVPIQQAEFDIPITYDEQPDLKDIPNFYQRDAGEFWIAIDEADGSVAGSIALLDIGDAQGALRKMFVRADHRGTAGQAGGGTAQRLLRTLLDHARTEGLRAVWLGTTEKFRAAHRFYEKHGFERVEPATLPPGFLRMKVDTRFYRILVG